VLAGKLAMQNCSMSGNLVYVAIPSQVLREVSREGVETRRAAPKPRIVRASIRAAKAVVCEKLPETYTVTFTVSHCVQAISFIINT
jgi:hypothetical protein